MAAAPPLEIQPLPLEIEMPPAPAPGGEQAPPRTWVNGYPAAEGTPWGLALRAAQVLCAGVATAIVAMFTFVEVPRVLAVTASAQFLWSLSLFIANIPLRVHHGLQSRKALLLFASGDMIIGALIAFGGACASAGVTILIDTDLDKCLEFECHRPEAAAAAAMSLMSCFFAAPSLFLNLWSFF